MVGQEAVLMIRKVFGFSDQVVKLLVLYLDDIGYKLVAVLNRSPEDVESLICINIQDFSVWGKTQRLE